MATLKQRMASHGFESNDDYEYPIRLLLSHSTRHLRALNIEGDSHRRKTAFASALAQALEYENVIYHDFTQVNDPGPITSLPAVVDDDDGATLALRWTFFLKTLVRWRILINLQINKKSVKKRKTTSQG